MSTQTAPSAVTSVELTQAHIVANTRLQEIATRAVVAAWRSLGSYNEEDVAVFLARVVPVILAAQRQSAALTVAFLARAIGEPISVDVDRLIGAAIRAATPEVIAASQRGGLALAPDATGVPPEVTYRRPFVGVWSDLADSKPWQQAVDAGGERAGGMAAFDVQNSMRHTLRLVGENEDLILGYRRVPDSDACPFCKLIAGRRYLTSELLPVHPRCCCGVAVITAANRDEFTGKRENDLAIPADGPQPAVVEHGEMGPLLVDASHDFSQIAA